MDENKYYFLMKKRNERVNDTNNIGKYTDKYTDKYIDNTNILYNKHIKHENDKNDKSGNIRYNINYNQTDNKQKLNYQTNNKLFTVDNITNKKISIKYNNNENIQKNRNNTFTLVTLIDWDDTIFPTTWYNNIKNSGLNLNSTMQSYDANLFIFLEQLIKISDVFIITNATMKWIEKTIQLLPKSQVLINSKIRIVSARDKYSSMYPKKQDYWKKLCFEKIIKLTNCTKVVSIGDSDYEKNALISIYENSPELRKKRNIYFKTIKFIYSPKIEQLYDEIYMLSKSISELLNQNRHNDLEYKY